MIHPCPNQGRDFKIPEFPRKLSPSQLLAHAAEDVGSCSSSQRSGFTLSYSLCLSTTRGTNTTPPPPSPTMRAWADLLSRHSSSLSNCLTHSLLGTEKTTVQLKSHVTVLYFGWRRSERMMNNNKKNRNLGKKMQTAATIHDASYE